MIKRNCVTHHYACDCREEMFIEIKKDYEKLIKDYNDELETSRHRALRIAELQAQADKLAEALETLEVAVNDKVNDPGATNFIRKDLADYEAWKQKQQQQTKEET